MSDLQIILIVIGILIIVAVLIFNWWQERRFHRQMENSFSSVRNDALFDEPEFDVSNLHQALNGASVAHPTFDKLPSEQSMLDQVATLSDRELDDAQLPAEDIALAPAQDLEHVAPISEVSVIQNPHEYLPNSIKNATQHADIKLIFNDVFNRVESDVSQVADQSTNQSTGQLIGQPIDQATVQASAETIAKAAHDNEYHAAFVPSLEVPALTLPAMLHPQIDLTAVLYLAQETAVSALSNDFIALSSGYDKSVFVHALNGEKQWSLLEDMQSDRSLANQLVSKIACSLQLADRAGAVPRNTLNRFQLAVETLGLDMNAHVEWQGAGDALISATELDAFCIEVDKTIGFHLVNGDSGAFTGTKLRGLAEAQGLVLASDGTFKYFDKDAPADAAQLKPSFVMFNREDYPFSPDMLRASVVKGITFQLDIPHVKQCAEAYSQMVQVAKQMELGLKALLVAENNKVLGDIQIEKIRQQLKVIHATMLTRGIVPGSDSALRLFS